MVSANTQYCIQLPLLTQRQFLYISLLGDCLVRRYTRVKLIYSTKEGERIQDRSSKFTDNSLHLQLFHLHLFLQSSPPQPHEYSLTMRYDDWDVLVMPLGSHIPIPEFRVEAYPVDDIEAPPINSIFNFTSQADPASLAPAAPPDTPPNSSGGPNLQIPLMYAQIPLLSCFVPSQPEGTAFKVSIHRWEQIPFNLDPVTISMTGRIPCCEIRVFVDGNLVRYITRTNG